MVNTCPVKGRSPRARTRRPLRRAGEGAHGPVVLGVVILLAVTLGLEARSADASTTRTGPAGAATRTGWRSVAYHGITLEVPASWPVYRLANDPTRCVRFDEHAVYLGAPGQNETCPAGAIGQTEAVLVEPLDTSAVRQAMAHLSTAKVDGRVVAVAPRTAVQPGYMMVSAQAHAEVVMTSGGDAAVSSAVTASIRIGTAPAATPIGSVSPIIPAAEAGATAHDAQTTTSGAATGAGAPARIGPAVYTGQAFDICTTPSLSAMAAWSASPYRGIGVYLGGDEAACSQPNLTSLWTARQAAAGWHLIPIYVGPQAACTGVGFSHVIDPANATEEGRQSAQAAVGLSSAVGLGIGNPIYYDMESWNINDTGCNTAVLDYLAGWTRELHALGHESGVYSSASTGITALVGEVGKAGFTEPDELWFGDWNGDATTSDYYVPASFWAHHQRIHQYSGNVNRTYGGVTLNIDGDYSDALLGNSGSGTPPGTIATIGKIAGDATLAAGQALGAGRSIVTRAGQYRLTMESSDGNLVLADASGRILWATKTTGSPGAHSVMQASDGNLVVYSAAGPALWSSETAGNAGARLAVQRDGDVIMYGPRGDPVWWTNTVDAKLFSGEQLAGNWYLESPNRAFQLIEQKTDGNLVLYNYAGTALWSSGTSGHPGAHAIVRPNGNFAIYSRAGRIVWDLGTAHHAGARLVVQSDGNVVLYTANGAVLWASRTS